MSPMQPGSPQAQMPAGEDALIRRIQELERTVREMLPSVALSFGPVVADLQAKDVQILDLIGSVVVPDAFASSGSGFAVAANTWETKASATLTTPAGFTKAAVFAFAYARILNTSGSDTYFSLAGKVAGLSGDAIDQSIPSGTFGNASVGVVRLVTDLTGGSTVLVETRLYSYAAFSTTAENTATIRGLVLWFR